MIEAWNCPGGIIREWNHQRWIDNEDGYELWLRWSDLVGQLSLNTVKVRFWHWQELPTCVHQKHSRGWGDGLVGREPAIQV